jgi:Skp family chaperone for outer membrane proteins
MNKHSSVTGSKKGEGLFSYKVLMVLLMAFASVAVMGILGSLVSAQAGLKVGVINVGAIQREFSEYKEAAKRLEEERRACEQRLAQLRSYLLLRGEELDELLKLSSKPALNEAEQRRLLELRGLHLQRADELQQLSSTPPDKLTQAQLQRLKELQAIARENTNRHKELAEELQKKLDNLSEQLRSQVEGRIKEAVAEVAKKEGLDLVLDYNAVYFVRGEVVDITPQVIKRLSKTK